MPRRPRVSVEGGIYHVYNRFARGAELFSEPEEVIGFIDILRKARNRDDLRVYAWTLMSDHYHVAFRAGRVPLSRAMGYVQARFGQGYNRRHGSSGPRWQSRYKAKVVETPEYFNRLVVYIHLNPVVTGLVGDPADYVLSGHRELLGRWPEAVSRWASRGAEMRMKSHGFREELEALDQALAARGEVGLDDKDRPNVGPGT